MALGLLTIKVHLAGCSSLKEKRMRLKPLLHRMHREFNISVAELDYQDVWKSALLGAAMLGSDTAVVHNGLHRIVEWIERNWPDVTIEDDRVEIYQ